MYWALNLTEISKGVLPSLQSLCQRKHQTRVARNIWDIKLISLESRNKVNSGGFVKVVTMRRPVKEDALWTSHTLLGKRGNMPYCYHRADMLAQQGVYEILQQTQRKKGIYLTMVNLSCINVPYPPKKKIDFSSFSDMPQHQICDRSHDGRRLTCQTIHIHKFNLAALHKLQMVSKSSCSSISSRFGDGLCGKFG